MIILTLTDTITGCQVNANIDLSTFRENNSGEFLDNESEGLQVVNAVADALKELLES